MAWITPTESDLLTTLSSAELTTYRAAATASGQTDPVAPTLAQVVDLVRGYVGAYKPAALDQPGTIPQKLLAPTIDLVAVRLPQRVGVAPKEVRLAAAERAIKLLEQVAAGRFNIEEPLNPSAEITAALRRACNMASILTAVQQEVANALSAQPFFAAIPLVIENPHDIAYELAASSAAASTSITILIPQAQVAAPNAPGPIFDPVEIALIVRENVAVANAPHALEIAETALATLHLYRPPSFNEVITAAPNALTRLNLPDVVAYEIRVRTQLAASLALPQLAAPVLLAPSTQSPQTVTLTSATPGAAIFATTDGTAPAPANPTATLITAPLNISAPGLLRARAWLAGYLTSPETTQRFN